MFMFVSTSLYPPPTHTHHKQHPLHFTLILTQRHLVGVIASSQKKEKTFEENALALEAAKDENMQLVNELEDLKMLVFAAEQAKESNMKYTARLDEHMDDVQRQLRTYNDSIKAKEKELDGVKTLLRSTQQALKVSEADRSAMMSKYESEMKNYQTVSREHERASSELEHVVVALTKLREDHQVLTKQKEEQEQKLRKQIAKEQEAGDLQSKALKSRLGTAMGDKALVVMKLQSELTTMAKWKEEQKEKKEAALEQIKQKEAELELERSKFGDKERIIRKKFETQKRDFAAEQLSEIERLQAEIDSTAEEHKQELAKQEEVRKKEMNMHLHQISSLKRDLKAAAATQQNTLSKLERAETSLKGAYEELQARKERIEAMELEFKVGYPPPPPSLPCGKPRGVMLACVIAKAGIAVLRMLTNRLVPDASLPAVMQAALSNVRHAEADAKKAMEIAKMDVASLKEAIEKKSDDIVSLQEMLEESTAEAQQAKKSLKANELQLSESKKLLATTVEHEALGSERIAVLMAEKNAVEGSLQASNRQVNTLQQEVQKLQDIVNRMKENGEAKMSELKDTLEVAKRMTKLKQAAAASSSIQEATSGLEEEKTTLETELADMTEQMETYRDQLDEALEREADLRTEMEAQEDMIDELHCKLLDAQIEASHLQGDVEELELQKQRMAASRKSSRSAVTRGSNGSLPGSSLGGSRHHDEAVAASEAGDITPSAQQGKVPPLQLELGTAQGNSETSPRRSVLAKIRGDDLAEPDEGSRGTVGLDEGPEAVGGESPGTAGRREGDATRKDRPGAANADEVDDDESRVREEGRRGVKNAEVVVDEPTKKVNHWKSRAAFFWASSEKEARKIRPAGTVLMKPKQSAHPPKKSPRSPEVMAQTNRRPTAAADYAGQAAASDAEQHLRLNVVHE